MVQGSNQDVVKTGYYAPSTPGTVFSLVQTIVQYAIFDPKHKLVWLGQFANVGAQIPGTSGNTSTIGVFSDAKAT